jgi:carbon monoxide dehydrogenase subunit G
MEIRNTFDVPLPADAAWRVLLDVPRIAPCLPGAKLTETLGENRYAGEVAVRLGPVMLTFAGRAEILEIDAATHQARVKAEGRDAKGRGGAAASVKFGLQPEGAGTRVSIVTDLTLSGAVAQYGRGVGMINDLANHLVGQFAANLRRELERTQPSEPVAAAPEPPPPPPPPAPISGGRLGLLLLWQAFLRAVKRLFGGSA